MLRISVAVAVIAVLAACATQQPAPVEERTVEERVRAPAADASEGLQVYSLRNPAVMELSEAAVQAEQAGDLDRAAMLLERALRIESRDPELLQQMAEVQLGQGDFDQAASFAARSFDQGPRVGEICQRNWRTLAVARERLGEDGAAAEARRRLSECQVRPPERF